MDGVPTVKGATRTVVPRTRAELDRFAGLVRSAVGASDARGDSVTVESVPFDEPNIVADPTAAETPGPQQSAARALRRYVPAGAAAALLLALFIVLAMRRRAAASSPAAVRLLSPAVEAPRLEAADSVADVRARALERAAQDPATAALVLRLWLGTTDAEVKAS